MMWRGSIESLRQDMCTSPEGNTPSGFFYYKLLVHRPTHLPITNLPILPSTTYQQCERILWQSGKR